LLDARCSHCGEARALLRWAWRGPDSSLAASRQTAPDELLSIERLEACEGAGGDSSLLTRTRVVMRGPLPRFNDNSRLLNRAYRKIADDIHLGQTVTAAEE
jgi:hypothetical protein